MTAIQRSNDEERRRRNTECQLHETEEQLRRAKKETALARVRYRQSKHLRTHEARARSQWSECGTVPAAIPAEASVAARHTPCALRPWRNFELVEFLQDSGRPEAASACFMNHLTGDDLSGMAASDAAFLLRLPSESHWPLLRKEIEARDPGDYRPAAALDSHEAACGHTGVGPDGADRCESVAGSDLPDLHVYEVWAWGLGGWGFYQRKGELIGTQLVLSDASRQRAIAQYEIANGLYTQLSPEGADVDTEDGAPERRWPFMLKLCSGEELTMYSTTRAHRKQWLSAFRSRGCADSQNFKEGKVSNVEHRSSVRNREDGVGFIASGVSPYIERTLKQIEEERLLVRSMRPASGDEASIGH